MRSGNLAKSGSELQTWQCYSTRGQECNVSKPTCPRPKACLRLARTAGSSRTCGIFGRDPDIGRDPDRQLKISCTHASADRVVWLFGVHEAWSVGS